MVSAISPAAFHRALGAGGVEFFCGVPDSLLKEFCSYIDAAAPAGSHVIAVNEGAAVAMAAGHHLATGKVPLVYMQNSGLGNAVNPILSLVDPEVYGIPMLLLVGWRGEPGKKDEPQHVKQGRVNVAMLEAMEVPHAILAPSDDAEQVVRQALEEARRTSGPYVLLVRSGVFGKSESSRPHPSAGRYGLSRERAIECILEAIPQGATVVSTTGKISREVYELREKAGTAHAADFLTVGSMGHASAIALGMSIAAPAKPMVCIDGDGAALMHLGNMTSIGTLSPPRFLHVVLNNGAHESVGGQPTCAFDVSLAQIARASGYATVAETVEDEASLRAALPQVLDADGPVLLEVRTGLGARADLGRPKESPVENKRIFMQRFEAL